jgi:hypothetical protein
MSMKVTNVKNRVLALGDNLFESGTITVPANGKIAAGTLLKRNDDGKFAIVIDTEANPGTPAEGGGWAVEPSTGDIPVAVMPFDLENSGGAPADFGFRALTGGRVRADMLLVNGTPATTAQKDSLRDYGIFPVKVKDLSQLDNQ